MEQTNNAVTPEAQQPQGGKRLKKEKKSRAWLVLLAFWLVVDAVWLGLGWYATRLDTFWPGSYLLGENVSGQTVAQAAETVAAALPDLGLMVYDMEEEDRKFSAAMASDLTGAPPHIVLGFAELGVTVDPAAAAGDSLSHQQSQSILKAGKRYLDHHLTRSFTNYSGANTYVIDETVMAQAARTAGGALSRQPIDTAYVLEGEALSLTAPRDGRVVNEAALLEAMKTLDWVGDLSLKAPMEVAPARVLTAQDIYDDVVRGMQNARYDKETDTILPEETGVSFSVDAAREALETAVPGSTVTISALIQPPDVTAAHLKEVLFRDVLGEAKTHVSGTAARISNVKLSAVSIHEYVMNPGDVFSYNEVVGQRTAENGYKPAPAYIKGETVDEIGGGICQTSSTLYMACLLGDIEIVERYAHRYVPAYILWGADATVSWGGPEFLFRNNTDYPIKIVTTYEKNYLTVQIFGTNVDGKYAKVTNEVLETTPWTTVYEADDTLAPGTEKEKTSPYTGYKVRTYHTIYNADGTVRDSHYEATSNYKVRNKVILRPTAELPGATVPGTPAVGPAVVPAAPAEPEVPPEPEQPIVVIPDAPPEDIGEDIAILPAE